MLGIGLGLNKQQNLLLTDKLASTITDIKEAGNSLLYYKLADLTSTLTEVTGGAVAATDDPIGMVLEVSDAVAAGQTSADYIAAQSELTKNGSFDTDTDWTKGVGVTISGGSLNFAMSSDTTTQDNVFAASAGIWHEAEIHITSYTSGNLTLNFGSGHSQFVTGIGVGVYKVIAKNAGATPHRFFLNASSLLASISSISVKELSGPPLVAPSNAARPIRKESGGVQYAQSNENDQGLIGPSIASFGTTATLIIAMRNATNRGVAVGQSGGVAVGVMSASSASSATIAAGTPDYRVNGVAVGDTRGDLHAAAVNDWAVITAENFDATNFTDTEFFTSLYGSDFAISEIAAVALIEGTLTSDQRDAFEQDFAAALNITF